ncbi:MAG: hypothetical protein KGY49_00390 [Wenzhouxiangellaceae bacterium]|nr:hypothetical protein [Wenzhouxiangellaceae bacterium]
MISREASKDPARPLLAASLLWSWLLWSGLFWPGPAGAQQSVENADDRSGEYPPVYRVEVIVFRHADGRSDRRRATAPADFTDRLDPLLVAAANAAARRQLASMAQFLPIAELPGALDEATPFLESEEETLRPIPPAYSALGDLSAPLRRAMSRLIDAPDYDPVTTRAWIQRAQRRQAAGAVRVHDRTVVEALEPAANTRPMPLAGQGLALNPMVETMVETTPPQSIYRLDGSVRLRQRQFLHLDLDLVWQTRARAPAESAADQISDQASEQNPDRNPDPDLDPGRDTADAAGALDASPAGERENGEWTVHRLQQSRVVRPGRLEYFDSSLFGVLVRIERFEQVFPEVEQEVEDNAPDAEAELPATGRPVTEGGG